MTIRDRAQRGNRPAGWASWETTLIHPQVLEGLNSSLGPGDGGEAKDYFQTHSHCL